MKIAGVVKNSFVDFKGQIAYVVFVPGCNLDCYFCHNRHLLENEVVLEDENKVLKDILKHKGFIDGVVISGGEPTIYDDLFEFARKIKDMDLLVKLDTNGFNPSVLKKLLDGSLLDYVAIDFKAPYSKMKSVIGVDVDFSLHKESINILKETDVLNEVRTTFLPELDEADIFKIASNLDGIKAYYLQQFRPLDKKQYKMIDLRALKSPHDSEYIKSVYSKIKEKYPALNVGLRGVK